MYIDMYMLLPHTQNMLRVLPQEMVSLPYITMAWGLPKICDSGKMIYTFSMKGTLLTFTAKDQKIHCSDSV